MKKLANFVKRDNKGFTLVEIIVVLAILAILIAVALPSMTGILEDSKGKVLMQDARAALIAFQLKATDTDATKITKTEILTLIDKPTSTTIEMAVKLDTNKRAIAFAYSDSSKVEKKAIGIESDGTKDDVAKVYSGVSEDAALTAAQTGIGATGGNWHKLANSYNP